MKLADWVAMLSQKIDAVRAEYEETPEGFESFCESALRRAEERLRLAQLPADDDANQSWIAREGLQLLDSCQRGLAAVTKYRAARHEACESRLQPDADKEKAQTEFTSCARLMMGWLGAQSSAELLESMNNDLRERDKQVRYWEGQFKAVPVEQLTAEIIMMAGARLDALEDHLNAIIERWIECLIEEHPTAA
jgi:hypothetical protein